MKKAKLLLATVLFLGVSFVFAVLASREVQPEFWYFSMSMLTTVFGFFNLLVLLCEVLDN
jgi:hypothetical protein